MWFSQKPRFVKKKLKPPLRSREGETIFILIGYMSGVTFLSVSPLVSPLVCKFFLARATSLYKSLFCPLVSV